LTDIGELGHVFREKFANGLRRLAQSGKLKLQQEWAKLQDRRELRAWLDDIRASDWNVFIEGPPHGRSRPEDVLKYLARYLTGGPISDGRIIGDQEGRVTFWARSRDKTKRNRSRPFSLRGTEFVRRWAMHILPKGYTRSRQFGGYHGRKAAGPQPKRCYRTGRKSARNRRKLADNWWQRAAYLACCQALLPQPPPAAANSAIEPPASPDNEPSGPRCPRCDVPLRCLESRRRPSWKVIFDRRIYQDASLYSPMHHIYSRAPPAFPLDE
jgi:hypothetical protein